MRGVDEEEKEKVRNEAGEFKRRNVEEKREEKFSIGRNSTIASNCELSEKKSRQKN